MKKLLYLPLFLLLWNNGLAQSIEFPDSFAVWYDQYEIWCVDPGLGVTLHEWPCQLYEMNGDTSFNGRAYKKLYLYDDSLQAKEFYVGLRSDSLNRVFVYIPDSTAEYIIYDFNWTVGDSILITYPFYQQGAWEDSTYVKIQAIDTVFIYGEYRKRALVYNIPLYWMTSNYWIEGVGSMGGLLYYEKESGHRTCIDCKQALDFSLSGNLSVSCGDTLCFQPIGIETISPPQPKIFPNPLPQDYPLQIAFEHAPSVEIQIFNNLGGVVFAESYENQATIALEPDLIPGIYYLEITLDESRFVRKVFVE